MVNIVVLSKIKNLITLSKHYVYTLTNTSPPESLLLSSISVVRNDVGYVVLFVVL